jgi:hypothetical protein
MSVHAAATRPLTVRLGTTLARGLVVVGGMALMMLTNWPGLAKIAALMTLALGYCAVEAWRHRRSSTTAGALWAAPAALAITTLMAVLWPLALPGERVLTVVVVAGAGLAYSVAVAVALRHRSDA